MIFFGALPAAAGCEDARGPSTGAVQTTSAPQGSVGLGRSSCSGELRGEPMWNVAGTAFSFGAGPDEAALPSSSTAGPDEAARAGSSPVVGLAGPVDASGGRGGEVLRPLGAYIGGPLGGGACGGGSPVGGILTGISPLCVPPCLPPVARSSHVMTSGELARTLGGGGGMAGLCPGPEGGSFAFALGAPWWLLHGPRSSSASGPPKRYRRRSYEVRARFP